MNPSSLATRVAAGFILLTWAAVAFGSEAYFENVAAQTGLAGRKTLRCIFTDLDGDGWPDVILNRQHVLLNQPREGGGRRFVDFTDASNLAACLTLDGTLLVPTLLIAGDVDNDGDVDLFAGYSLELEKPRKGKLGPGPAKKGDALVPEKKDPGIRSRILLNDGTGRFSPLEHAGVETPPESTSAAAFLDYDNDGSLDLFTGNWYRYYGWSVEAYTDRLLKGDGRGRFRDVTDSAGLLTVGMPGYSNSSKPTYGVTPCDWNDDGFPDLLVSVYGRQWNFLWRNQGNGTFVDEGGRTGFAGDAIRHGKYPPRIRRRTEAPYRANGNTFDAAVCDFDNDGDFDVFVAEITHWWAGESSDLSSILVNQGKEKGYAFVRKPGLIQRAGPRPPNWNQGDLHAGWFDFNNDMRPDLLLASSDYPDDQLLRLFVQKPDHTFEDVTDLAGFNWRNPTGISLADFDGDGDVDILVGNNNMRLSKEQKQGRVLEAALFRNRFGQEFNFLSVRLLGRGTGGANKQALGARVWVCAGGVVQVREVRGGEGHAGHQNYPVLHFGLHRADHVDWLKVRWPDGKLSVQTFQNPGINRFLELRQGAGLRIVRDLGPRKAPSPPEKPGGKAAAEEDFRR